MNTIEKITKLFDESNKSARQILIDLKLSPTAFAEWKRGKANPTVEAITKIADYFNVSVDYLLGREEKNPPNNIASFEKFKEILYEKGMTEKDIEGLSKEQLAAIVDIVKNFKQ